MTSSTRSNTAGKLQALSDIPAQAQILEEGLFREVADFPSFGSIEHGELLALRLGANTTDYTHGLHRFPAKFIPQIPRWALREFASPGARVIDPFMGSGTTLVESLVAGCRCVGTDIDPLARLISRAKTSCVSPQSLADLRLQVHDRWAERLSRREPLRPPMPDIDNFDHWFARPSWRELAALRDVLRELPCGEAERTLLWAIFSSILRWVSNADDQSQKTYVSGTLRKSAPPVAPTFWRAYERALEGIRQLERARHPLALCEVPEEGDATRLPLPAGSVDLIVTSPPYLDSVDYMYNLMAEYFWMGPLLGLPTRLAFNDFRRKPAGAKNPLGAHGSLPPGLRGLLDGSELPPGRERAAAHYFGQMQAHFGEAARVLKHGARYVMVVGNSQTRGGVLPVHHCLVRLAQEAGLHLERAFGLRVRRHYMKFPRQGRGGIIVMDWVLVLRRLEASSIVEPASLPLTWLTLANDQVAH